MRRPADLEFGFHVLAQAIIQSEFPESRPPAPGLGETFSMSGTVSIPPTVAEHLPRNSGNRPTQLGGDRCQRPASGETARDRLTLVERQPQRRPRLRRPRSYTARLLEPQTGRRPRYSRQSGGLSKRRTRRTCRKERHPLFWWLWFPSHFTPPKKQTRRSPEPHPCVDRLKLSAKLAYFSKSADKMTTRPWVISDAPWVFSDT
ncbi:hypothetical protein RCH22_003021 [Cryobacterium psychrotolerans]|nr:hypothetical protein [Cryobacterium psychrotolerans]